MHGGSVIEVVTVTAIVVIAGGVALAGFAALREHARTAGAARYLAATMARLRLDAVRTGTASGLWMERTGGDYLLRTVRDGNGNGVRLDELARGVDLPDGPPQRLSDRFPGATLAIIVAAPPLDAGGAPLGVGDDPVRLGGSDLLAFSPAGTGTSGTVYVAGPGGRQFAVRIFGPTGRLRIFEYLPGTRTWATR